MFWDNRFLANGLYKCCSLLSHVHAHDSSMSPLVRKVRQSKLLSRVFPHGIFYMVQADEVTLLAVSGLRRNPVWVNGRLNKTKFYNVKGGSLHAADQYAAPAVGPKFSCEAASQARLAKSFCGMLSERFLRKLFFQSVETSEVSACKISSCR